MERTELIEKAAKAMVALAPGEDWETCEQSWYLRDAEAALAVFEEQQKPTEDEREALAQSIRSNHFRVDGLPDDEDYSIADTVLAAGFRRPASGGGHV